MSTYQRFSVKVGTWGTPKWFTVNAEWLDGSGSHITQITEVSYNGGVSWLSMINLSGVYYSGVTQNVVGAYDIRIRENGDAVYQLGSYNITSDATSCRNIDDTEYLVNKITRSNYTGDNALEIQTENAGGLTTLTHSINGGVTTKNALILTDFISTWDDAELVAVDPLTLPVEIYTTGSTGTPTCTQTHSVKHNFETAIIPLTATATFTNPTANAASDGAIDITVVNGSGSFTYLWTDAITTEDRTGLVAGSYSVTITDTVTAATFDVDVVLVEPEAQVLAFYDTFVSSSPINPIRFKEVLIGNDLPMDNYNYCEQPTEEIAAPPIYEGFNVTDQTAMQFRSDFQENTAELENIHTGATSVLALNLAVDNLSGGQEFAATISDNGLFDGSSSIRINNQTTGDYPNPLVGSTVTISDSTSYDGSYDVVDVSADESYVVLAVTFTISEACTVKFLPSDRFNVYELPIIFSDWGVGAYKITIRAIDNAVLTDKLISENINIEANTPNTLLLTYSNVDTSYKVSWGTGIVMRKRHSGIFIKSVPTRDSSNFRNSNDTPSILNAYVRNKEEYNIYELPWYAVQRLALIYSCDSFFINNKKMFIEELPDVDQPDRYMLSRQTVVAEEVGWLDDQNTHDIGDTTTSIVIGGDQTEVLGI